MLLYATGIGLLDHPAWEGLNLERTLQPGALLGPYEILEEVGAGGMGRVYKARDTRLGRIVAVKVLNAAFSHRLRIEGRAISALNHPHVCALYDIGDREGYLVMEYVEGESLAGRLARGPLPFEDVLRYGEEIADALAAAHAQGIVHRDLKPANIMITASGVKVLDFGVARIARDEETPSGGVAGTAAYMSPSQLNGNPADERSDIFALGLVLYEMAAGTRYSDGSPDSLAALPAGLANLVRQCLRKDAAARVQHMEEVRSALRRLRSQPAAAAGRRFRKLRTAGAFVLAAALVVLAQRFAPLGARRTPPAPAAATGDLAQVRSTAVRRPPAPSQPAAAAPQGRTQLPVPPPQSVAPKTRAAPAATSPEPPSLFQLASYPGVERDPSISPDGSRVAFSWQSRAHGGFGIYVKTLQKEQPATELTQGYEDWGPAWSPDGRSIAFRRKGGQWGIYRVAASGGPAQLVAPIRPQGQETLPEMSWSHDGQWIAAPDRAPGGGTQIFLFPAAAGEKRELTVNLTGTDHAPAFSPDGKSLAYASCLGSVYPCAIHVIDFDRHLAPKLQRMVTEQTWYIRGIAWLPGGRGLVYAGAPQVSMSTSLWRLPLRPPGPPERIDLAGSRARHPALSPGGGLLAFTNLGTWRVMLIRNFQ